MTSFAEDLVTLALVGGRVTALGTDIFKTSFAALPNGDGPYVNVVQTGGAGTVERHDRVGHPYKQPAAQITVRAKSASAARTLAQGLHADFCSVRNTAVGDSFYLWVRPTQSEPFEMPADEVGRARYTFNLEAMKADT